MKTMTDARTFNTGTYGVEGIPLIDLDGMEHLGLPMGELAKVEQAIALAALEDGCRDPEALRFARKSLGLTVMGLDEMVCVAVREAIAVNEDPSGAMSTVLRGLLLQRDRGGFVARRVTV